MPNLSTPEQSLIDDRTLYSGPSTQGANSAKLSPAERRFFSAISEAATDSKKSFLTAFVEVLKPFIPVNKLKLLQNKQAEQKALEELSQNRISYALETSSYNYFLQEALKNANTQIMASHDPADVQEELRNAFHIGTFNNVVQSFTTEVPNIYSFVVEDKSDHLHQVSHRSSAVIRNVIKASQLSPAAQKIANMTLAQVGHKMDILDDTIATVGSAGAREKLAISLGEANIPSSLSPEMTLFVSWKNGRFGHDTPVIKTEQDAKDLAEMMAFTWKCNTEQGELRSLALSRSDIDTVSTRFARSVLEHDRALTLRAKPGKKEKPAVATVAAASPPLPKEAITPLVAAVEQEHVAPVLDKASKEMLDTLRRFARQTTAQSASHAARFVDQASTLLNNADSDDATHKLVGVVLGSANLLQVAQAMGVDGPIKHISPLPAETRRDNAKILHDCCQASEHSRQLVRECLEDDNGLLLASLILDRKQFGEVAGAYGKARDNETLINSKIKDRETRFANRRIDNPLTADIPADDKDLVKFKRDLKAAEAIQEYTHQLHATVADIVNEAVAGKNPRTIELPTLPDFDANVAMQRVPSGWDKERHGKEYRFDPCQDNSKNCKISSREFPQIQETIRYEAGKEVLKTTMDTLAERCKQHQANLVVMDELSSQYGFAEATVDGKRVFQHAPSGVTVGLEGTERAVARQLQNAKSKAEQFVQQAQPELSPQSPAKPVDHEWKPDGKDTLLIFDTNALHTLSARRGPGKTWLDLVRATAELPNVTVVIPDVVGTFELQGRVRTKSENGNGTRQVDESFVNYHREDGQCKNFQKTEETRLIQQLLKDAAHGMVHEDGTVTLDKPKSNIVVLSTPQDAELYKQVARVVRDGGSLKDAGVYGNDEGEKAISRIIAAIPHAHIGVITDDGRYVREAAPQKTRGGLPVAYGGTCDYVAAEISASPDRYLEICTQLGERAVMAGEDRSQNRHLSYQTFAGDVVRDERELRRSTATDSNGAYGASTIQGLISSAVQRHASEPKNGYNRSWEQTVNGQSCSSSVRGA